MYLIDVFFTGYANDAPFLINQIVDQWRYNGQIIGREIPLFLAQQEDQQGFALRVVCPEQQSLLPDYHNQPVQNALQQAENRGIFFDSFQVVADDLNSDSTSATAKPNWQLLYTTYLQSCSPLHSGDDLSPIPLYLAFRDAPHLSQDMIKWQENWQACDQLQMNGSALEQAALNELSAVDSTLFKHGYALRQEIEQHTHIPTYYYLYRVGGESLASEQQRCCPRCHSDWRLATSLFDMIYFKCDNCRLVSNLSWSFAE
ncbi:MAG: Zn-ribbon-containing protein [Pasteurellaceae bacterium]|nr:Zn-ribbon-containing protein [Pasteurellaceae bacterium]